jgi:hypothetical protein
MLLSFYPNGSMADAGEQRPLELCEIAQMLPAIRDQDAYTGKAPIEGWRDQWQVRKFRSQVVNGFQSARA